MTTKLAIKMLTSNRIRFVVTIAVIAVLFFLSTAQLGMLVGWCNTISAIVRNANVDVWVMAKQTTAFDYGTPIPEARLWQVRGVPGVAWAEGMFVGWNTWKAPDGRHTNIEVVGLDESCVGGPWSMAEGRVTDVQRPNGVIVDELFADQLGVAIVGDTFDLQGKQISVEAISRGVRSFTTAPFVFTTIENARRYDGRYHDDEITYVLVRGEDGVAPAQLREAIAQNVPHVEALTTREFVIRSIRYWMLNTGVGITIVLTAALGWIVGAMVMSQTLYALTQDHRDHFATLLAVGFEPRSLLQVVLTQAFTLGGIGIVLGTVLYFYAHELSRSTSLPLELNAIAVAVLVAVAIAKCVAASLLGARSVAAVDPFSVFRG